MLQIPIKKHIHVRYQHSYVSYLNVFVWQPSAFFYNLLIIDVETYVVLAAICCHPPPPKLITIVATRCFFRFGCPLLSLFGEGRLGSVAAAMPSVAL